jgi:hypothetical protein
MYGSKGASDGRSRSASDRLPSRNLAVLNRDSSDRQVPTRGALRAVLIALACVGLNAMTSTAAAAQQRSMREVLSFLVTNQAIPTADVIKDREAAEATLETLGGAMLVDVATLPLASSSSAFTYRFSPALGTLERLAQSFGPFLVDRAVTTGRRQITLGAAYRYVRFTTLDGRNLRNGTLVTTANRFRDEPNAFDVEALTLQTTASTMTVFGNVGVTDRLDVGAAVPVVHLALSGERVNTYRGERFVQARATANVTGLADIALRAKAQVVGDRVSGVATGLEVRLPTGDRNNLIGAGHTGFKTSLIGSVGRGPVDIHANAALVAGGVSREIDLAAAGAIAVTPRLTVSSEVLMRRVKELGRIADVIAPHPLIAGVDTIRLSSVGGNATTASAVAGFRWNVTRTLLVNTSVVFPLTGRGLRATALPSVSIDYSIQRSAGFSSRNVH